MRNKRDNQLCISVPSSEGEVKKLIRRPEQSGGLDKGVRRIVDDVRRNGDAALAKYSRKFDGVSLTGFRVSREELDNAADQVSSELKEAVKAARRNIERFHRENAGKESASVETVPGVTCWQKSRPIDKVGLYVPGGTAPLISTVLMLGIPAGIAGCGEVILCTPPGIDGGIQPEILYTATVLGIDSIFKAGGAQAIAAMAYGTGTIPRVFKIFGPGNRYVTLAKQLVSMDQVSIDMPAGPSELMIVADGSADPEFLAADLLSQAEHGWDSQVILFSTSMDILKSTLSHVERQVAGLSRREVVVQSLRNSRLILVRDRGRIFRFVNDYSPEHLIIATENPEKDVAGVRNAGSVFLGNYTPESAGDYISGTNHTLPTGGWARSVSSLTVDSFRKVTSFQSIQPEGLRRVGKHIEVLADAEGLDAHREAVSLRLRRIGREGEQ